MKASNDFTQVTINNQVFVKIQLENRYSNKVHELLMNSEGEIFNNNLIAICEQDYFADDEYLSQAFYSTFE